MISNSRADYGSADEWLSALMQDDLWQTQLQQLRSSAPHDASTLRDRAYEKLGKGETYGFWDSYNHQVAPVVREVWEIAELSLPKLKIQTIGMLSLEWLELQAAAGARVSEKTKNPSSRQKPKAARPKAERKPGGKPMTLKYYTHGNKGVLMRQRKRVRQVFNMWNRWGWIDEQTSMDDFDAFFEGEPKHCNITWTGSNTTILTFLLQELLEQPYIEKQTGCAAKSLVRQQFGKTANSDRTRLDNVAEERIKLTLFVLDPKNHDLIFRSSDDFSEIQDIQDAALKEVFAGHLRSTKGI